MITHIASLLNHSRRRHLKVSEIPLNVSVKTVYIAETFRHPRESADTYDFADCFRCYVQFLPESESLPESFRFQLNVSEGCLKFQRKEFFLKEFHYLHIAFPQNYSITLVKMA